MQKNKYFFIRRIMVLLWCGLMMATAQATEPVWTIVPAQGSNPTQTVPENATVTVQYVVQNQSWKSKKLVMQSVPGISQTAPCQLAPRGQAGSSCILNLTINGSALPQDGVHSGPVLCQANFDGSPNPNQCYQPSRVNSLNITRGPVAGATITVNPTNLNFIEGTNGVVTVTNSAISPEPAENIVPTIPVGSNISIQNTTCGTSLAIGATCTITFTAPAPEGPTDIGISGSNTNIVNVTVTVTPTPMATISVNPTVLSFVENSTGDITVTNNVGSPLPAENITATIPVGSNISVQNTTCGTSLAIGATCTITFTAPAPEGPTNVSISGSNTNTVNVTVTVTPTPMATISVSPTTLLFAENSTGDVVVTNDVGSPIDAENITATIPGGSNISIQSTTCGPILAIGMSCTITFSSGVQEGPTTIPIAGDNTNTVNVNVTVTSQPQISITNPVQQNRVVTVSDITPLSLEITNNAGSLVNANAITVSNKTGCPNLSVDNNDCTSVSPGASCTLELTSSTPYVPCTITVSGSNTANSPTALIAFSHLGGLVFAESGGSGKVVINVAQGFNSVWINFPVTVVGATSTTNGTANTTAIMANTNCTTTAGRCAARSCRNISADWYLPARAELTTVHGVLCSNAAIPCNFGGFVANYYWSSTQAGSPNLAWLVEFPSGFNTPGATSSAGSNFPVRCIRTFSP